MYVIYYKDFDGQWENPGDYYDCCFDTYELADEAINDLIHSEPTTWEDTEFKIEEEDDE